MNRPSFTTETETELRELGFTPLYPGEWRAPGPTPSAFVEKWDGPGDRIALHYAGDVILCTDLDHVLATLAAIEAAEGDA